MSHDRNALIERSRQFREWSDGPEGLFAVFKTVRANYVQTLIASDILETELREEIYRRIRSFDDIETVMRAVISEGAGAAAQIAMLSKIKDRT